jgi:superfamily II DNA or RNA helicase
MIRKHAVLGKRGYTIPKSALSIEEIKDIKRELMVKPVISMVMGGAGAGAGTAFPLFRENEKKIYVPRFYGIETFGSPEKQDIAPGDDIHIEFVKPLRDYQEEIVATYINHVSVPICSGSPHKGGGGILEVHTGSGKTIMALKIASLLSKKTIILVHKEFLMNQWQERIEEYVPGSRVGRIQGPIFDIENKDIVLGMIQSLYDKEYPVDMFSSFGLTIIDEVHRIGSEQFSKTLLRIITPYMLGISATVDRKDKLTKILYMFIGPKIVSKKRDASEIVSVRMIHYMSGDAEFRETEYDYRGNPKFSTMISKLCDYGPRSDFIVRIISDLVMEDATKQIMVLGHNRSILKYLYEAVEYRAIASVGFYLGGMKQKDLTITESKQIVLATYAMAAEALDIKTLSTLIMISPKTDITQSVGRILRAKHENPIIVDIVDEHEIFRNQAAKRRSFYKKANYRIREIHSPQYSGMRLDWRTDTTWRRTFEPKIIAGSHEVEEEEEEDVGSKSKCLVSFIE